MTKKNETSIKQGTVVSWASSGRGSRHKKSGKVKRYLAKGENARDFIPKTVPVSKIMTRNYASSHRRFLVVVDDDELGTIYYTPRAVTIENQNRTAGSKAKKKAAKA